MALHLLDSATKRERGGKRVPICLLCCLACSLSIGHHSVPFDALIKCHVLFFQENHRIMALPTTLEVDIPMQTKTGRDYHSVHAKIQITLWKDDIPISTGMANHLIQYKKKELG